MLKKILAIAVISSSLAACASWFSSSSSNHEEDNPAVGSKDSSDFLFGEAASAPVASSPQKMSTPGAGTTASAPVASSPL